ncbi:MAG: RNA-binding protein [Candidatus Dependentiae bacterium]|nr:RNA-binding protein [Candidatus Dependentiae bacterium]
MNIYVGRLNPSVNEDALREMFEVYGQVTSIKLIKDKFTGNPRGFGFVEMPNGDEAQNAITELNGKEVSGSRIIVNEARPQENREFRPRTGGYNREGGNNNRGGGFGGNRSSGSGFGGNRSGGNRW